MNYIRDSQITSFPFTGLGERVVSSCLTNLGWIFMHVGTCKMASVYSVHILCQDGEGAGQLLLVNLPTQRDDTHTYVCGPAGAHTQSPKLTAQQCLP